MRAFVNALERPRLLELIDNDKDAKIVLLAAPAGYGKLSLARQWASRSGLNVVLVRLREEHDDPSAFERLLLDAMQPFLPEIDRSLDTLSAAIVRRHSEFCFILENFQTVRNEGIHASVAGLAERLHGNSRVILISRTSGTGMMSRLGREGKLLEIGAANLAFTEAESISLFGSSERTRRIHNAGLGWIAGIKLEITAGTTLSPGMPFHSASSMQAPHHFLDEYVYEEVLAKLPPELRMFVLRTCDLPEISVAICNAAFGEQDHVAQVQAIVSNGLDIRWHAEKRGTFSYNPLFAESCQRLYQSLRSEKERRSADLGRAVRWHQSRGELDLAIEIAIRAESWSTAVDLLRVAAESFCFQGKVHQLLQWFERVPSEEFFEDVILAFWYCTAMVLNYEVDKARFFIRQIEYVWYGREMNEMRSRLAFFHSCLALIAENFDRAIELGKESLRQLPEDAYGQRFLAHYVVFSSSLRAGLREQAEVQRTFAQELRRFLPSHEQFWTYTFIADWADYLATSGDLSQALAYHRIALAGAQDYMGFGYCWLLNGIVSIADEQDDLEVAEIYLKRASSILDPTTIPIFRRIDLVRTSAQHARAAGRYEEAFSFAEEYIRMTTDMNYVIGQHRGMALLALLWAETGDLERALRWATEEEGFVEKWPSVFGQLHGEAVRAEIFFRAGQDDRALMMVQYLITEAQQFGRTSNLIRLHTIESLIFDRRGDVQKSQAALMQALQLGERGGFVRSFHVPGFSVKTILATFEGHDRLAAYAETLMANLAASELTSATWDPSTILSPRELDILDLLAQGFTNPEIAHSLFISSHTVRNHVARLFKKLGVTSRTEIANLSYRYRIPRSQKGGNETIG